MDFEVLSIEERVDGTIRGEWQSVADDDLPLIEADVFTPPPGVDLETAVAEWLESKADLRAEINARPRPVIQRPAVKRSTAVLNTDAFERVASRVRRTDGGRSA